MTHTYSVTGMFCGKCLAAVKSELLKLGDVSEVDVQLESPQATISMQKHISLPVLQSAISKAGSYVISETRHHVEAPAGNTNDASLKVYWPLVLVLLFVTGISFISSFRGSVIDPALWMNYFMGGFFLAFSFFKLLDLKGFAESYSTYDILAMRAPAFGFVYPFVELALGVAYITGFQPVLTNLITILIMGFGSLGVIRSVRQKRQIQCACLGTVFNLPMSTVTILENFLMIVMALLMLVFIH